MSSNSFKGIGNNIDKYYVDPFNVKDTEEIIVIFEGLEIVENTNQPDELQKQVTELMKRVEQKDEKEKVDLVERNKKLEELKKNEERNKKQEKIITQKEKITETEDKKSQVNC
jgi:hypothetical protein